MVVLAGLAIGVYANSLPNEFVYDDHAVVVGDQRSHSLSRIPELFTGGYWTVTRRTLYRPITLLSFALNHAVTGLWAPGYRAVNLALHALVCVVLFQLMRALFGAFWPAFVAGLVYAVHPIHVEAVVPIVGRSELLSTLGVTTAMWLYVRDAARGGRGVTGRYVGVLVLAWAAMLSKENAVVLIALVAAFDVWRRLMVSPSDRVGGWEAYLTGRFLWRYAGLLGVGVVVLTMRHAALGMVLGEAVRFPLADNPLGYESWSARLLTGLVLLGKYARLLVLGYPLCCDYSPNAIPVVRSFSWVVGGGLVCGVALVLCLGVSLLRRRQMVVAVGWFLLSYAPVANVFVLIGTMFAERLMYLPSVAVAMAWGLTIPALVSRLWNHHERWARVGAVVIGGIVATGVTTYAALTMGRNRVWRTDESLYRDGLAKQPNSARCQYNMGAWYAGNGQLELAVRHLRRAIEIVSPYYLARTKLASCHLMRSQWPEVVEVLDPLLAAASPRSEHLVSPLYMVGKAKMEMGRFAEAWDALDRITRMEPNYVPAMRLRAELMAEPQSKTFYRPGDAWALIQEAVHADPEEPANLLAAARIALRQKRVVEAGLYLDRADDALRRQFDRAHRDRQARVTAIVLSAMKRDLDTLRAEFDRQTEERRSRLPWVATPTGPATTTSTAPMLPSTSGTATAGVRPAIPPSSREASTP